MNLQWTEDRREHWNTISRIADKAPDWLKEKVERGLEKARTKR